MAIKLLDTAPSYALGPPLPTGLMQYLVDHGNISTWRHVG